MVDQMTPQQEAPPTDPQEESHEEALFKQLVAESVEYIHGKARDQIVDKISESKSLSETMAGITYKVVRELVEKHKQQGMALELDMDFVLGLATEVIDMLVEITERVRPSIQADLQTLREDTLLRAAIMHAEQLGDDPQAKEQAKMQLRSMIQDGSADQAFGYVNKRAAAEGIDVNDMINTGNEWASEMVGGGQKPVAQGVQRGLMNG